MTCWALIPVKAPGRGKTRLASILTPTDRNALVTAMLRWVVEATLAADLIDRTVIIGPSCYGLDLPSFHGGGENLRDDLAAALHMALRRGVRRAIIIPADLPQLQCGDVDRLARVSHATIVVAPDRHGTGTNALSLPLPQARDFVFAFGPDSFRAHRRETERLGLAFETVQTPGLECDIDEPEDLIDIPTALCNLSHCVSRDLS